VPRNSFTAVFSFGIVGPMLPEMSMRDHQLERRVFGGEVTDRLRPAVFGDVETRLRDAAHELAVAVATVTVTCTTSTLTFSVKPDALRANRVHDAAAGGERRDGADLMWGDGGAGVPLALERQVRDENRPDGHRRRT
jgi:hypothetical protein